MTEILHWRKQNKINILFISEHGVTREYIKSHHNSWAKQIERESDIHVIGGSKHERQNALGFKESSKRGILAIIDKKFKRKIRKIELDEELYTITLTIKDQGKMFNIKGVYGSAHTEEKEKYWRLWLQRHSKDREERHVHSVVLGDLNEVPDATQDRNSRSGKSSKSFLELVAGMIDLFRQNNPNRTHAFTFQRTHKTLGVQESRIDHIFSNKAAADLLQEVRIHDPVWWAPDHSPIIARFKLGAVIPPPTLVQAAIPPTKPPRLNVKMFEDKETVLQYQNQIIEKLKSCDLSALNPDELLTKVTQLMMETAEETVGLE
jgi:exonuclease III